MLPDQLQNLHLAVDIKTLHHSATSYFLCDEGDRILYLNPAMEKSFGHTLETCLHQRLALLFPDLPATMERASSSPGSGCASWQTEAHGRTSEGRLFPCQVTAIHLLDTGHGGCITLGTARDITEQKRTVEALRSHNDRLGALASIAARLGVYRDMHRLSREAMQAIADILPIKSAFLLLADRETGTLALHEAFNLPSEALARYHTDTGWNDCLEGEVLRKGGPILIEDVSAEPRAIHYVEGSMSLGLIPLLTRERALGVLSVTTAAPHRLDEVDMEFLLTLGAQLGYYLENARLLGELRESNRQLLRQNQDLEELLSIISHDLRSPLATIGGYASLLMTKGNSLEEDERAQFAETIFRKTRETSQRFDDLLDLFRETGRTGGEEPVEVDLREIINRSFEESMEGRPLESVRLTIPGELPRLQGYPTHLMHVLTNLFSNAIKFMGDQEEPAITVTYDRIQEEGRTLHRFQVADNGMGISRDYLPTIFRPFTRAPTGRDIPGTGMGLASVLRIVRGHGGTVEAESAEGKGSTFTFTLPWKEV